MILIPDSGSLITSLPLLLTYDPLAEDEVDGEEDKPALCVPDGIILYMQN